MSDSPLIAQPGRQKMTLLRESYLGISEGDACAARILNAAERWLAYKLEVREELRARNRMRRQGGQKGNNDEDLWLRMAIDPKDGKSLGWKAELMHEYSYKVILRGLDLLVGKGYLAKRENPRQNWDRTPQWLFQVEAVQAAVDAWAASRANPGMTSDPDGVSEQEEEPEGQDESDSDHSADSTDSTRQIDRVVSAERPSRVGKSTELTRQKDRSNNTGIPTQYSPTDIPSQTSSSPEDEAPAQVPDDDRAAVAEEREATELHPQSEGNEGPPLTASVENDEQGGERKFQLPAPEKVPGAAGGAALLGLAPVPRGVLTSRPARDPATMRQLRALLFCSNKSRLPELQVQLARATPSRIPRELFTRLTDAEIQQAVDAARRDMPLDTKSRGFEVLAQLGLDRLIGETLTLEMIAGQASVSGPSAPAVTSTPTPAEPPPPSPVSIDVDSRWEHKRVEDKVVTVVAFDGPKVELHTGEKLASFLLLKDYRRVH